MSEPAATVRDLRVRFCSAAGPLDVLDGISLELRRGELLGIIGPSGCGKTTLLHLLMNLTEPSEGTVAVNGTPALVFQKPRLLPWRRIVDNAAYGLECRGVRRHERRARASKLLDTLGLGAHLHDRPHQLSEGMKQRVNLARALLVEPDVLLLDEPFSALDLLTKRRLQDLLLEQWQARGFSAVFVSHSLEEVAYLCDRVVVLGDKPTRIRGQLEVGLARPRAADAAARLQLFEVVDDLAELLADSEHAT